MTNELFFKTRNQVLFTDYHRVVVTLAVFQSFAIDKAFESYIATITLLSFSLSNFNPLSVLLTKGFDHTIYVSFFDFSYSLSNLNVLKVVRNVDFRLNFDRKNVREIMSRTNIFNLADFWITIGHVVNAGLLYSCKHSCIDHAVNGF